MHTHAKYQYLLYLLMNFWNWHDRSTSGACTHQKLQVIFLYYLHLSSLILWRAEFYHPLNKIIISSKILKPLLQETNFCFPIQTFFFFWTSTLLFFCLGNLTSVLLVFYDKNHWSLEILKLNRKRKGRKFHNRRRILFLLLLKIYIFIGRK